MMQTKISIPGFGGFVAWDAQTVLSLSTPTIAHSYRNKENYDNATMDNFFPGYCAFEEF